MREPIRRKRIMNLLGYIWENQNDTRFNQLIHNLQTEYSQLNNGFGKEILLRKEEIRDSVLYFETPTYDFFYLEDDEFIKFLEEKVKELWRK